MIRISQPYIDRERLFIYLEDILKRNEISYGKFVEEFEKKVREYIGVRYSIATSSGTTALLAAFASLNLKPGDKFIVPSFTFIASASTGKFLGFEPVFVDVYEDTYNINVESVKECLENDNRIKAILVVHLYGLPADIGRIKKIAKEYGVYIIEDCAQAFGAEYYGRKVGSFGDVAIFSFYATKIITTGEGGMLVTNDKEIYERAKRFINHGRSDSYIHSSIGLNFRTSNINAAFGLVQMEIVEELIRKRRELAKLYNEELNGIVKIPYEPNGLKHVYNIYTIRVDKDCRDNLVRYLNERGIEAKIYYPIPLHKQPVFEKYNMKKLETCEKLSLEVLSLPIHPLMNEEDINYVVNTIKEFLVKTCL